MAITLLPPFFVLQHNKSYLSLPKDLPPSLPSGSLKFEQEILSPRVKFAVEQSATGNDKLVHIRCCYNNKYLAAHESKGRLLVTASADKPQDSCTWFVRASSSSTLDFEFLCFNRCLWAYVEEGCLTLKGPRGHFLHAVDWETLVILPKQVSFKSEDLADGNYLCSRVLDRYYNYHRFESGLSVGDERVAHDLFPTSDGNYRIKDLYFGKFWRRSPNWIWADAEDNDHSDDTLFSFVKISDNVFALRNLGNNYFCGRLTTEGKTNCLNAHYPNISREARLLVEERVMKRVISNVRYRLFDSRIYQEEILEVNHAFAVNDSPNNASTITTNFSITESTTTSWNNSVSVTKGVKVEFHCNIVPRILSGKVEVSTEFGSTYEWGGTETRERKRETSYAVVVPPLTKMKVTLLSTRAACDVPYSYTQRDLLTNGKWVSTVKDDGVYSGINSYNFYFQSSEVTRVVNEPNFQQTDREPFGGINKQTNTNNKFCSIC